MICTSLESAHAAVIQLVEDFSDGEVHYLSPGYSEAPARVSFIDKLWMALGWDVHHEHQKNPYAQEVKVEDPQKIAGSQRHADYAFHTAPNFRDARFFCEAKKPHVQLKTDADSAFQTIRYGWSAGTPLAVLTDFEQLHVLDCRAKPNIDTALARSHLYFHYKEWLDPEKFAQLYYLFSREAFRDGGFDAYVSKLPRPKKVGKQPGLLRTGTQPVDAAFLTDLEGYRETLAKLLKAADHTLDGDALTELVQRILDRLVFLRFLEDKLIETENQVHHFSRAAGSHSWAKFLAASRKLDARYNGIVFKHHPILDTPGRLRVDDANFADLCEELSHTKSPYDFNAIPIHILGSIYERFLGKVIVTTEQRARVEEKPEVRKAGGVYYTPEYIVRYICEQTVGRLIEGKSPAQIAKMRFADIACGSGSFLLGVYDLLLRAHEQYYNANPKEAKVASGIDNAALSPQQRAKRAKKEQVFDCAERDGVLRLTLEKKREILLNNVFGVDLDPQAVEVAQLSLYLKLLEEETTASAQQHYLHFHEALLPSLNKNVVRGNSLVGTDILFGQFEFSQREERKLSPMDYESTFPAAMKEGGFDAVVGNPPYIFTRELITEQQRTYYAQVYELGWEKQNTYMLFMEKALQLLKPSGLASFIVPNSWLTIESAKSIRAHYLKFLIDVVDLNYAAFEGVSMEPSIFVATGSETQAGPQVNLCRIRNEDEFAEISSVPADRSQLRAHNRINFHSSSESSGFIERLLEACSPLGEIFDVRTGLQAYEKGRGTPPQTAEDVKNHVFDRSRRENSSSVRYVEGRDVQRYRLSWSGLWMQYGPWLSQPREIGIFTRPRILLREITAQLPYALHFNYTNSQFLNNKSVLNVLDYDNDNDALKALLGVLNSKLVSYFYKQHAVKAGRRSFPRSS